MALTKLPILLISVLVAGSHVPIEAGEFNRVLSIGDSAPAWIGLPSVEGTAFDLANFADKSVVVIVFTCNSCPYAVDAEDRLNELHTWLTQKNGQLVAINVNTIDEDALPAMRERAAEKGFEFPYLFDASQQIARDYGATTTPEYFVLDRERKIVYMGSLDDSPDGREVTKPYVKDAVASLLVGSKVDKSETVPIGCRIRFDRVKRTRK